MQTDTDPYVQFNKPFQSGEGMCYPIYPWNYYNIKRGGGKSSSKKNIKKGGSNYQKLNEVDINTKQYFGPFLYPPVPFNSQAGGKKKKYNKKGGSNNKYITGPEYLNQQLVPTTPSSISDLQYNGSFTDTNPEWKQSLTGYRLPPTKGNIDISKNYGVTYATTAGGKPKKSTPKKKTATKKVATKKKPSTKKVAPKKKSSKVAPKKKASTKKVAPKKKSSKVAPKTNNKKPSKKQKGGATSLPAQFYNPNAKLSTGLGCTTSAYGKINAVSDPNRNLAPCPNSSGIQTGGKKQRKTNTKKGGSSGIINTFYTKTENNSGNVPGYDSYMLNNVNKYAKYNGGSQKIKNKKKTTKKKSNKKK